MAPPEQPTLSEIKTEKEHQSKSIIELHYFLKSAIIKALIWKMVCILGLRGAWTSIKKNAIRCLVFFLTAIFVVSGALALRELQSRREAQKDFNGLAQRVQPKAPSDKENSPPESAGDLVESAVHKRDIAALTEENADCIGWVCVPDTMIDYPVMFTPDEPQRYLRRSFSRGYSICGVPFLDGRSEAGDINRIIYGHNMKDGTMFAGLHGYEDALFREEHPVIEYETTEDCAEYTVFAVLKMHKDDPWYDFLSAADSEEYARAVDDICRKALYDTEIRPSYPQELLTLSTCGGRDRDARLVVVAIKGFVQR